MSISGLDPPVPLREKIGWVNEDYEGWSRADDTRAWHQGWGLHIGFPSIDQPQPTCNIMRCNRGGAICLFDTNEQLRTYVQTRAEEGDELCQRALVFCMRYAMDIARR